MPGFQPQIKRLVVEATADNEHFLGVRVRLPAECACISPRKKARQSGVFTSDRIDTQSEFFGHLLKPAYFGHRDRLFRSIVTVF